MWIKWNRDFRLGITVMDTQHHLLVDMINNFGRLMLEGQGEHELMELFGDLASYVDFHFHTEGRLMNEYEYPDKEIHKAMHRNFSEVLANFILDQKEGKRMLSPAIHRYLRTWLTNHILDHTNIADRRLARFLLETGYKN